jgi:hypothetical protein
MEAQPLNQSPAEILQRIDAIMRELEELRRAIIRSRASLPPDDLAQQLYGVLGQGSWSEYDMDLDWQRFKVHNFTLSPPPGTGS